MLREPSLVNRPLHDLDDPTNYDASGYPLHQTSLWSQLYGRLHFVHFDSWPPTWESDSVIVHWIGRAALVLGLVPTTVLLIGLVREGRRSLMVLAGRRFYPVAVDPPVASFVMALLFSTWSILAVGFVIASIVPTARFAQPIAGIILWPMVPLSGLFFPIEDLPSAVQAVARVLPLTYAVSLLEGELILVGN